MIKIPTILLTLTTTLLFCSCNEDPELVKKNEQQQADIARLTGEVTLLQAHLDALPADKSAELLKVTKEAEKLHQDHQLLTDEVTELEAEKKQLQDQYEAYQRKYVIQ
jgi:uncharacterized protein YlxW (UPF0749 family)